MGKKGVVKITEKQLKKMAGVVTITAEDFINYYKKHAKRTVKPRYFYDAATDQITGVLNDKPSMLHKAN